MPAGRFEVRMVAIAISLAAAFAVVAARVEVAGSLPGDRAALEALHRWLGERADRAMEVVDAATDTWPLAAVAVAGAVVLVLAGRRRDAAALITVVAAAVVANPWWKDLFERPRPTVRPIPVAVSEHAFPSGHAATSAALVVGALLAVRTRRGRRVVAGVGAAFLLVAATAQLILGAHAPSDVLASWLWIGAWGALVAAVLGGRTCRRSGTGPPPGRDRRRGRLPGVLLGRLGLVALAVAAIVTGTPGTRAQAESCAAADTAAGLDEFFARDDAAGLAGADYPHAYALPDGRALWLFQDAFVGGDRSLVGDRFAHNAALVQDGTCFELLPAPGGDGTSFLGSWVEQGLNDWIWPLDAEVGADGNLWLFVAEVHNPTSAGAASGAFPLGTWRARYSLPELELIDFQPAADPGRALFGYSIVSDEDWSYLYGHCYTQFASALQAIGFDPTCSPYAYLARVPKGQFDDEPEYWDGDRWTDDRAEREPVLEADPSMPVSVERFGDVYVAVSDEGDWYGDEVVVRTARLPQGPWTEALRYTPETACADCNNYGAFVLPELEGDRVVIAQSNNAWDMGAAFADASLYRIDVRAVDVPGVSAASLSRSPAAQPAPVVSPPPPRASRVETVVRRPPAAPRERADAHVLPPVDAVVDEEEPSGGVAGRIARLARAAAFAAATLVVAAALLGLVRTVLAERRRRLRRPSPSTDGRARRHGPARPAPDARGDDDAERELVGASRTGAADDDHA